MIHLPDYKIKELISKSNSTTILRAIRISDNINVVIKLLNSEYPSTKELSDFIREYEIMNRISCSGIIKAYALLKFNNSLAIIMEDIGGDSVAKVLSANNFSISEKLSLAIQMTNSLMQLHKQNIIHKDINPTNFIWNYKTNQVKIIDFGISTELVREAPQSVDQNIVEGTLNYISPEQTGRINRPIDYRTDLYSLGITFYEIFTGQLPFQGTDELDLIYCHIAKAPEAPKKVNDKVPDILSDIIMKLISKTAEERYQSAFGLLKDLEYCAKNLDSAKNHSIAFIPGQGDVLDRFEIPNKLYGREAEIETLIDGFGRAMDGNAELILVSGYSGIGKSSLIQEIRKPITLKKGFFISGNFSQYDRNVPYSGISKAFNELLRQLFLESQQSLDRWRHSLLEAVGKNGQVIIDIIPELEQIIGPQPHPAELNPLEAQNRFQITFFEFIKVFAGYEHPLVVFLDDLQWCDNSSLDLMRYILTSGNIQYILFIGAYRDNEVQLGHPLLKMLDDLKNAQLGPLVPYNQIILKPLDFSSLNQLIADTLHTQSKIAEPLTKIVLQKTKGNPYFIRRMLNRLYRQGAITFLPEKSKWTFDLKKVKAVEISENVVDLLVKGLEALPEATMEDLKLCACIGAQFDLATVSLISKKPVVLLGKELWIAIERSILLPLNNNYRLLNTLYNKISPKDMEFRFCFSHDHIRQAVYSMISRKERNEIHLKIGRESLKVFKNSKNQEAIFELVRHFDYAKDLIKNKRDRFELMELNILAGNKAKKSTAFAAALNYFEIARSLLSAEEWAASPDKLFSLVHEQASAALLSGDLLKAETNCDELSKIAKANLEKGAVSNLKVLIYIFQGKLFETISETRKTLSLFNIILPESAEEIAQKTQEGLTKMQAFLAKTPVEELVDLPIMVDPEKLMAMQLLFQVAPPAIQVNPALFVLTTLTMFELTLTYGTSPLSSKCFGDCGVIQGTVLNDYETGYKLGLAAFALINKFKAEGLRPAVYFIFTYLSHWRAHFKESLDYYDMSYRAGLETGDLMHATYALAHKAHFIIWTGKNLSECKSETDNSIAFLKQSKAAMPLLLAEIVNYTISKLQTPDDKNTKLLFETHDKIIIEAVEKSHNLAFRCRFYNFNTLVSIIMGNMEDAEKWSLLAESIIFAAASDFPLPDFYLFKALIIINKYKHATVEEKTQSKETLLNILKRLKYWAENCHENFAHKYYLLSAEIAIMEDRSLELIVGLYNKAKHSIENNDFIHMKALCNELFGVFWSKRGEETIAKAYIQEAYYSYKQWGAIRKVAHMERYFSHYFLSEENTVHGTVGTTFKTTINSIDRNSILKSTQAISSEIKIEKLLTILINTMIENACAQRACLLLKNEMDGQFYVEAVQSVNPNYLQVMNSLHFTESKDLCVEIVQYVTRTRETIVIHNAGADAKWQNNPYIIKNKIKSVLCLPVYYQNRLKAIVYLENNLSDNVFTMERLETLKILSSQAAISIENARLYENMEEKVRERTLQLNSANEKLKDLSIHDPLTGLHNRRYVFEFANDKILKYIEKEAAMLLADEKRELPEDSKVFGVFLIDIDFFKLVNDTYGHTAGDGVLFTLSKVLKLAIKSDDLLVRWGGEEFLIILYNRKPEELEMFSKKLLKKVQTTPMEVSENVVIYKTVSLGYVEMPFDKTNPGLLNLEQIINISDYALYCAKENGRNCSAHFKMIKPIGNEEALKKHLINLSKSSVLNEEYFKVEFI